VLVHGWITGCGVREAPAPTGQVLYLRHCASCHGVSGRGDGPVAASLQKRPIDLTTIAKREGGRFDEARVMRGIDGQRLVPAHGPREMPVWGAVFSEELEGQRHAAYVVLLHARSLTDYVRSIQEE
jgi:mono/diheme cytochrome c family protein